VDLNDIPLQVGGPLVHFTLTKTSHPIFAFSSISLSLISIRSYDDQGPIVVICAQEAHGDNKDQT
jgi:hypothetical protein